MGMYLRILALLSICLTGLACLILLADRGLGTIQTTVQEVAAPAQTAFTLVIRLRQGITDMDQAVDELFFMSKQDDADALLARLKTTVSEQRTLLTSFQDPALVGVVAQPLFIAEGTEGKDTSIFAALIQVQGHLDTLEDALTTTAKLATDRRTMNGQVPPAKEALSKAFRAALPLQAVDAKAFGLLARGSIVILSTSSGRDVKFAGQAKFEEGLAAFAKMTLDPSQKALLDALNSQFVATYELVRVQLSAQDDSAFYHRTSATLLDLVAKLATAIDAQQTSSRQQLETTAEATRRQGRLLGFLVALVTLIIGTAFAHVLHRRLVQPITATTEALTAVAAGDLDQQIDDRRSDELGRMAKALNACIRRLQGNQAGMQAAGQGLQAAAGPLNRVAEELVSHAAEVNQQAKATAETATRVSEGVTSMAGSAEEMQASISQVADLTTDASALASDAKDAAASSDAAIAKLHTSSTEIGSVVQTIVALAHRTNLLALNASIEAASAGAAGKGFAVVANEVKVLAQQSGTAAKTIAARIEAIQGDAQATAQLLAQINGFVARIHENQMAVAAAMAQQRTTMSEVAHAAHQAAAGTAGITAGIAAVAEAAQATDACAARTRKAAAELQELSSGLDRAIVGAG